MANPRTGRRLVWRGAVLFSFSLGMATTLWAQSPPPVQGTIAPEDTTRKVYAAGHVIIVSALDGIESVLRYTRDLFGGKGPAVDPLGGLREGSTVVVRQGFDGAKGGAPAEVDRRLDEGAQATEAIVTSIDRARRNVTIRFDDGRKEKLRLAGLTGRTSADTAKDVDPARTGGGVVTVSYADDKGERIDRLFTKTK
jgi:hypothetical protein